jgi:prepilin-type N-terminal cleavage/methylation domain-containing protein
MKQSGFTSTELMIVLSAIGVVFLVGGMLWIVFHFVVKFW